MKVIRSVSRFIFCTSAPFVEKTVICPLKRHGILVNSQLPMNVWVYFWTGSFNPVISMFLCQYHTISITVAFFWHREGQLLQLCFPFSRFFWLFWVSWICIGILGSACRFWKKKMKRKWETDLNRDYIWIWRSVWGGLLSLLFPSLCALMSSHLLRYLKSYNDVLVVFTVQALHIFW